MLRRAYLRLNVRSSPMTRTYTHRERLLGKLLPRVAPPFSQMFGGLLHTASPLFGNCNASRIGPWVTHRCYINPSDNEAGLG